TLGCVEKDEGREQGKVLALQEDQARLQATIGQEQAPSLIGKAMVKDLHSKIPCVCFSLPMYGRVQLAALAQLISEKAAISSRLLAVRPRELMLITFVSIAWRHYRERCLGRARMDWSKTVPAVQWPSEGWIYDMSKGGE